MNIRQDWRALSVGGAVVLVLLSGALLVQHLRHGWPFSLHHGIGVPATAQQVAKAHASAGESAHPRAPVEVEPAQLASIGVRTERVKRETISRPLRAVATVVPDESRLSHVHTRVSGWVERLYINTTGQSVRAGEPLAAIFSQELLSSQNEYLGARRAAASGPPSAILEGARSRLKVLGMTDAEIRALDHASEARRLVTLTAPRSGVVIRRGISVGTAVDPSTEIVSIADLSGVWVLAEVPESDIPDVGRGTAARLTFPASGLSPFDAKVDFLYPTLSERTRTLRVRFVVDNAAGSLRPGLYGTAEFAIRPREVLTAPRDAIVDTGRTQHVFVVEREGRFVPKPVELGTRFDGRVEVRRGLSEGDSVVASGVFLIDSESRLRASGGGTGHVHGATAEAKPGDHAAHQEPPQVEPTPAPRAPRPAPKPSATEDHSARQKQPAGSAPAQNHAHQH